MSFFDINELILSLTMIEQENLYETEKLKYTEILP
nr:MAG TPA: hypothetical protein [Caudoviricetes sp.]